MKGAKLNVKHLLFLGFAVLLILGADNIYKASKGVVLHYQYPDQQIKKKNFYIPESPISINEHVAFYVDHDFTVRFECTQTSYSYTIKTLSVGGWQDAACTYSVNGENRGVEVRVLLYATSSPVLFYLYLIGEVVMLFGYAEYDTFKNLDMEEEDRQFWEEIKKEEIAKEEDTEIEVPSHQQ